MRHSPLLLLAGLAVGQSNVATITGILTDPTGAVVPGAEVLVTNQATRVVYRTQTNEAGVYIVPSLMAGPYSIEIQASGFKRKQVQDLVLETGQKMRLDVALEVGTVAESVEVKATAAPLMQESAELSDTFSPAHIQNLPLNNRDLMQLLLLSTGIAVRGDDPTSLEFWGNFSINGSRAQGTPVLIDGGVPANERDGVVNPVGSLEAFHEFKVLTSTYSAEYGRTSGGLVTFQVKSGTADYHGSLYEYHRNSALDANNWQNNAVGVKPSVLIQNQFGGTLGGPAPGLGKKLFFFASYEGERSSTPRIRVRTIPDPAIRGGNFGGLPATISDPVSGIPFPNNTVPPNRLDPAAVKFLSLFPGPNTAGIPDARLGIRTQNWIRIGSRKDPQNYGVLRLDYNPTSKDKLFATYLELREGPWDDVRDFDNPLNTVAGLRDRRHFRFTLGYTRFVRPNLANDSLVYLYRDRRARTPLYPEFDVTRELGIQRKVGPSLPTISVSGGFGSYGNSNFDDYIWQPGGLNNVMSYLRGRHTMKFGLQLYQNQYWDGSKAGLSGSYSFNGESTGRGAAGRNNPLNALADLLLGSVKTAGINIPRIPINRVNYSLGFFFQDDWKVTSRLTLNLGLRHEYETPPIIKNNVYSRVDLATGDLLVAGRNASRNLNRNTDYLNFSPRLGLAYLLNDKTVVRSGFAVFHSNLWNDLGGLSYPGWSSSVSFVDQGLGRSQPFTLTQGFPTDRVPAVTDPLALFAAATVQQPLPVGALTYNPTDRLPYVLQWNLTLQRKVAFNTLAEAGYVASRSLKLSRTIAANSPRLERSFEVVRQRAPLQQVRPYPRFTGFNAVFYDATADYHSLQLKATRRFSSGISLDANYTFSKNIDTASLIADSFQIPWQFANIERALSSLDRTHFLSIGWVYELPIGQGKPLFVGNPVISAILGGFQFNGIFTASSGVPLTINQQNTNLILASQRPDAITGENISGKAAEPRFEGQGARRYLIAPDAPDFPFSRSSDLGFGSLGRNTSREPGYWNFNLSLFREFPLREPAKLELRLEAFDALNHVNFLQPATNIDLPGYGLSTAAAPARQVQIGAKISF